MSPETTARRAPTAYAINYVHGYDTRLIVVTAGDPDDAYDKARGWLLENRFYSAALQGCCRVASESDVATWEARS